MSSTVITALYNIGRDKLQGYGYRPFQKYLDWFRHLLAVNVPMVIFVPSYLVQYVQEHRPGEFQTSVIVREIEELHWYSQRGRIQEAIDSIRTLSSTSQKLMSGAVLKCPEYSTPLYDILMFSKVEMMREAAESNPFGSQYFIWMDAGTFSQPSPLDSRCTWPDPYKMKILDGRFLIQENKLDLQQPVTHHRDVLIENWNLIYGYMMAGDRQAVERIQTAFRAKAEALLAESLVSNDQNVMYLVWRDNPEWFLPWSPTYSRYRHLASPSNGRMLPYELAVGTLLPGGYRRNDKLKMLTVATREVTPARFEKWKATAKYYGYNYEILGRDEPWTGFNVKTRQLYDRLTTITEPYVAFTDCLDLFFTASADEMVDTFESTGQEAIVGGELHMAYPNGRLPFDVVKEHFERIKESSQCFPNSGFLIGKTAALRKLIALHLDHPDDQAACFETIYHGRCPLIIDYRTQLIGNVPNYGDCRSEDYYEFDPVIKRYRSKAHGTTPQALHFPGSYFRLMDEMYANIHGQYAASPEFYSTTSSSNQWQILGFGWLAVVILILFMFILYPLL